MQQLIKAVFDENMFYLHNTLIKVRILDQLTLFIGSKNRGKEGISKTGPVCQERFMCRP
jgi:hypothetical protein